MSNIPESLVFYKDKISDGSYLRDMKEDEMNSFVTDILEIMASRCGGHNFFWKKEDEKLVFSGWVDGLKKFTLKEIVNCLLLILDYRYSKKDDHIPRSVIDFGYFLIETRACDLLKIEEKKEKPLELGYDEEGAKERALEARNKAIGDLKKLFPRMYKNLGENNAK